MSYLLILLLLFYILLPFVSSLIVLFLYFVDLKRNVIYSFLLSILFGILAFHLIPKSDFDLYRLQNIVFSLKKYNFNEFLTNVNNYDLELIPMIYSFIISLLKNVNYLQFFVVFLGYFIIFYVISDYFKIKNIRNRVPFVLITLFGIFGINILFFFSGLYCYFGMIFFFLIFYLDYVKKMNKKFCIILYLVSLFIHSSLFVPTLILFIYKKNNKINFYNILICFLLIAFSKPILDCINGVLNFEFLNRLVMMYDSYTNNEEHYRLMYSGFFFLIEISKIIFTLFMTISIRAKNNNDKISDYLLLINLVTILLLFYSRVSIRYAMISQLIGCLVYLDYYKKDKSFIIKNTLNILLFIIIAFFIIYFIHIIKTMNFGNFFQNDFIKNIFELLF